MQYSVILRDTFSGGPLSWEMTLESFTQKGDYRIQINNGLVAIQRASYQFSFDAGIQNLMDGLAYCLSPHELIYYGHRNEKRISYTVIYSEMPILLEYINTSSAGRPDTSEVRLLLAAPK